MSESKGKLASKLVQILDTMGSVNKSGHNKHQNYHYATENDILETIRPELVKHKIFIFFSVEEVTKEDHITTVRVKYTFVDGSTGEEFVTYSAGQGADKQDKGIYKAITGAHKYMFMKNFLMETNDDPENDGQAAATSTVKAPASGNSKSFGASNKPADKQVDGTKPKFGQKRFA